MRARVYSTGHEGRRVQGDHEGGAAPRNDK